MLCRPLGAGGQAVALPADCKACFVIRRFGGLGVDHDVFHFNIGDKHHEPERFGVRRGG